jgi:O-succinylbenzoate synthase
MNVALFRQYVVLAHPVRSSAQVHDERSRLYLRLEDAGVEGYGEVAPQPYALNGDPGFDDVLEAVGGALARLTDVRNREGVLPTWSRVARLGSGTPASNVASALLEMAVLDREVRIGEERIEDVWAPHYETPLQATVSLLDDETAWNVEDVVQRVRAKSAPGPLSERALDRLAQLVVPVVIDYNCSVRNGDDVLSQVDQIREVATIAAVEQPFAVGNVIDHAQLAARLDVPLSIDEGVRSLSDLILIANYDAAAMVCVKPARVGGLASARAIFSKAEEIGLRAYLGGFFESPFARHVHRALANHCVREPSDLLDVALQGGKSEVDDATFGFGVAPSSAMLASAQRLSFP